MFLFGQFTGLSYELAVMCVYVVNLQIFPYIMSESSLNKLQKFLYHKNFVIYDKYTSKSIFKLFL